MSHLSLGRRWAARCGAGTAVLAALSAGLIAPVAQAAPAVSPLAAVAPSSAGTLSAPTPSSLVAADSTSDAATTETTGTLHRISVDDLEGGAAREVTTVASGTTTIEVPAAMVEHIPAGSRVTVAKSGGSVVGVSPASLPGGIAASAPATAVLGAHSLLVVPVFWNDNPKVAWDATARRGSPDVAGLTAVGQHLADYFATSSGNQITVEVENPLAWKDLGATVSGCSISGSTGASKIKDIVLQRVADERATVPEGKARHVLAYFPQNAKCGKWGGLADVGGPNRFIYINGDNSSATWIHEFGHNLGLRHSGGQNCTVKKAPVPIASSCKLIEYDDPWDLMGNHPGHAQFSAQRLNNLGLMPEGSLQTVNNVKDGTEVTIAPLTGTSGVRGVRVPVGKKTYSLEYRSASGMDAWLSGPKAQCPEGGSCLNAPSPGTGVVVRVTTGDQDTFAQQYVVNFGSLHSDTSKKDWRGLQPGESYTAADKSIGLSFIGVDNGSAKVKITLKPDTSKPSGLKILSPVSNGMLGTGDARIAWTAPVDKESAITKVSVYVDAETTPRKEITDGTTETVITGLPKSTDAKDQRTVKVVAENAYGLTASATTKFTVTDDTTGPVVGNAPTALMPAVVGKSFAVTWGDAQITDAGVGMGWVALEFTAKPGTPALPASKALKLVKGTAIAKGTLKMSGLPVGSYTLRAVARDLAQNSTTLGTQDFRVSGDTVAPGGAWQMKIEGGTVTYTISGLRDYAKGDVAAEGVASVAIVLDGKTTLKEIKDASQWSGGSLTISSPLTGLTAGRHSVALVITDVAGNARTSKNSFTV